MPKPKRYKVLLSNLHGVNRAEDSVIGLFKGIIKGQAVAVSLDEVGFDTALKTNPSVTFKVKPGFEDMFVGQIESYGFRVIECHND
jgi:hypothetical protein